jgi:hypothetical protein
VLDVPVSFFLGRALGPAHRAAVTAHA